MSQDLSIYTEDYYLRDQIEFYFKREGLLRPDELACICYSLGWMFFGDEQVEPRDPGLIYSIGCGTGEWETKMESMGYTVVGVDPSEGANKLYKGKKIVRKYPGGGDTIVFCESIEHIPSDQLDKILSVIPKKARIIIVNWVAYHPIIPDGTPDHITRVDDDFYDKLSKGRKVIVRNGSHLVLDGC